MTSIPHEIDLLKLYPSQRILKKMGLIQDQDGIMKRYLNEGENWESHIKNTSDFIKECLTGSGAKSVSILGSGWMLDIPQRFLADNFELVLFYDLRHPRQLKHKYRKQRNFQFIEMDLTGGILEKAYRVLNGKRKVNISNLEEELIVPPLKFPIYSDFIVSVNILNQLDILIVDYLKGKIEIPNTIIERLRRNIQQNHLNILEPGKSLLITDFEEISLDSDREKLGSKPLIYTALPQPKKQNQWTWKFDTQFTYHQNCLTNFEVMALMF